MAVSLDVNGWRLYFHKCIAGQLERLHAAVQRAEKNGPMPHNANVKLFQAVSALILKIIPSDPNHARYRLGKSLGEQYGNWRRAKIGRRFRLFFRYDSQTKVIIYSWLNDADTLRAIGSSSDPYAVFRKMLERGNPPSDWQELLDAATSIPSGLSQSD